MMGDQNDQSGTVGFLVGIVVLVFAGIFFSLLVDKRFRFSSGKVSLEEDVREGKLRVEKMNFRVEAARELWKKKVQPFEGQDAQVRAKADELRATTRELAGLRERREALEGEILAGEGAFLAYRNQYRQQARVAAAGEELAELASRNGRTYRDVTIRRVTVAGVEIEHSQGISRLRPEDLGEEWRERFQWHPEEAAKPAAPAIKAAEPEEAPLAGEESEVAPTAEEVAKQAEARKLAGLRRDVSEARRFLQKAESELARARAEARNSRAKSVPGSLETWADKVRRMESTRTQFRTQYDAALARLAAVAPDDSLLRKPEP